MSLLYGHELTVLKIPTTIFTRRKFQVDLAATVGAFKREMASSMNWLILFTLTVPLISRLSHQESIVIFALLTCAVPGAR